MANDQLPMQIASSTPLQGQSPNIQAGIPLQTDTRLPMAVKPFENVDPMVNAARMYTLADKIDDFKERQSQHHEAQILREEQIRDKAILDKYSRSGGDLYSPEGVDTAIKTLGDKVSSSTLQNLNKLKDQRQQTIMAFRQKSADLDDTELKLYQDKYDESLKTMLGPLDVYEKTKEAKGEQAAQQAFAAAKAATIQMMSQEVGPNGQPKYSPQALQKFSAMSSDALATQVNTTKWHRDLIKDELETKLKTAQARAAETLADEREQKSEGLPGQIQTINDAVDAGTMTKEQGDAAIGKLLGTANKGGPVNESQVKAVAHLIASGKMAPLTGFAMRTPYGQAVMAEVASENPDYDAKDFSTHQKAEKDFATGKQGNTVRSFNVALDHLSTLSELSDALKNNDIKAVNKIANAFAEETGGTAPSNFNAAKQIVGDEIIKAVVGSGGALGDREKAQAALDPAKTPGQLKDVVTIYKKLMQGQLTGLEKQYSASTGKNDFAEKFLSENVKKEFKVGQSAKKETTEPEMKISTGDQSVRDVEAGRIRVKEVGGVEKAKQEVAQIDEALKSAKGDAKNILEREKRIYTVGIEAEENSGGAAKPSQVAPPASKKAISLDEYLKSKGY